MHEQQSRGVSYVQRHRVGVPAAARTVEGSDLGEPARFITLQLYFSVFVVLLLCVFAGLVEVMC